MNGLATLAVGFLLVVGLAGCAHRGTDIGVAREVAAGATEKVVTIGRSVQGRGIAAHEFNWQGAGVPVVVFAGIHGDEPTTVYCAERLLTEVREHPDLLAGAKLAIITCANPDGLMLRTRQNARRVDLNRNFPTGNWRPGQGTERFNGGPAPLSEPESRALYDFVRAQHPVRICSIHSIGRGRQQNNYDGPARALAELMAASNHYPASPNIGYETLGSFGVWAGVEQQIPVITLELPNRTPGPLAWEQNRAALFAFIRGR